MDEQKAQPGAIAGAQVTNKMDETKKMASDMAEDAKRHDREKLDSGKQVAANQTEKLADVVQRAAHELRDGEQQSLADYAGQLAGGMRTLAENLRSKSIDELLTDTQELARKNPAMFFIGTVALGVAVSRFLKASGERKQASNEDRNYRSIDPAVQPVVFEPRPEVLSEASSRTPASAVDDRSFADDREKGI